jgi:hypothetical protein
LTSGAKGSAGTATRNSTARVQQGTDAAQSGVGGGSQSRGAARPGIAGSLESTKVASLRQFLAYVWPAIALGPAGKLWAMLQVRWEAVSPRQLSGIPRLLSRLARITGAGGVAGLSKDSGITNPAPDDSTGIRVPEGSAISLIVLLVSCAALMALLVFTVTRELRSNYRWPL